MFSGVYFSVAAQWDNLGDLELRRITADWCQRFATPMHVFIGAAPDAYLEGCHIPADAILYRDRRRWLARSLVGAKSLLIVAPGEHSVVGWPGFAQQLAACGQVLVRSRSGATVRIGRSIGRMSPGPLAIEKKLASWTETYWRDSQSLSMIGAGRLAPDVALSRGRQQHNRTRNLLVVSARADRIAIWKELMPSIRTLAEEQGLLLTYVTQVGRDDDGHRALAGEGEEVVAWGNRTHTQQEYRVREAYSGAACVITDRLHSFLFAESESATGIGIDTSASAKLRRNLGHLNFQSRLFSLEHGVPGAQELHAALDSASHVPYDAANRAGRALLDGLYEQLAYGDRAGTSAR